MRDQSERVAERVRQLLAEHATRSGAAGPGESTDRDETYGRAEPMAPGAPAERFPAFGAPRHTGAGSAWSRWRERWPVRVDPGRRSVLAVGVAVLVAALLTGAWLLVQRPQSAAVSARASGAPVSATPVGTGVAPASSTAAGIPPPASSVSGSGSGSSGSSEVVVDVAGKVAHPGLYRLPPGSRIDDAVRAAGGALHGVDLINLNLAQQLVDGQQIVVGAAGAAATPAPSVAASPTPGGASGSPASGAPVSLNNATLEQLETLPGVGPVLAQHILDYRAQHGPFATVDQLDDVPGIGTVKFAALKPLVTV